MHDENSLVRRPLLTDPGESLLAPDSPVEKAERWSRWLTWSGMAADQVVESLMITMPFPRYRSRPEGSRHFPTVAPSALWCPLFWLPPRLSQRYELPNEDGSTSIESDDLWAIRIALDMSMSGLYDPISGEWADVLEAHGIDTRTEADLARVAAWQQGRPDEVLDSIDLTDFLEVDEPDQSLLVAVSLESTLRSATWYRMADELAALVHEEPGVNSALDTERRVLARAGDLSYTLLSEPTGMIVNPGSAGTEAEQAGAVYWDRLVLRCADADLSGLSVLRAEAGAVLTEIVASYEAEYEKLVAAFTPDLPEPATA